MSDKSHLPGESPRGMFKRPPGVHTRISSRGERRTAGSCHASVVAVGFRFRADCSGVTRGVVKTCCATTLVADYVIVDGRSFVSVTAAMCCHRVARDSLSSSSQDRSAPPRQRLRFFYSRPGPIVREANFRRTRKIQFSP